MYLILHCQCDKHTVAISASKWLTLTLMVWSVCAVCVWTRAPVPHSVYNLYEHMQCSTCKLCNGTQHNDSSEKIDTKIEWVRERESMSLHVSQCVCIFVSIARMLCAQLDSVTTYYLCSHNWFNIQYLVLCPFKLKVYLFVCLYFN